MTDFSKIRQLSDEELAAKVQAGSHHYFEELINRYSRKLYVYLRAKVSTEQDVEDLVQEVFLRSYRSIKRYNQEYKFSTWIYTIATRLVISYYRKNRQMETVSEPVDLSPGPQENVVREDMRKNLWEMARTLKTNQYRVLWLRYIEEMSLKEIARVMKKTPIYVRVLLHRARLNLIRQIHAPAFSMCSSDSMSLSKKVSIL